MITKRGGGVLYNLYQETLNENRELKQEINKLKRTGEWIFLGVDDNGELPMFQCSECKKKRFGAARYCPNCGAKMGK